MNGLQAVGTVGSIVCTILVGVGVSREILPLVGVGVIGALVFVLVFAVGRMSEPDPPPRPPPYYAPSAPPLAFPVEPARGRFRVHGVDRETKMDTTWHCYADSPENAKVKGELEGVIVTRVESVKD